MKKVIVFLVVTLFSISTFSDEFTPLDKENSDDDAFLSGGEADEKPITEKEKDQAFLDDEEQAEIEAPEYDASVSLHEDPEKKFFSVGLRLRWIAVPKWFVSMFGVDINRHPSYKDTRYLVSNVGIGPEFTYRRDGMDVTAAIWYMGLNWQNKDPWVMKGKNEGNGSWEVIDNDIKVILITADFIWSTDFTDWMALTYGVGIGMGITIGDIVRTEAKEVGDGTAETRWVEKCNESDVGNDTGCVAGEEYGETYDKFAVIPWINLLWGMRFKPHQHLAIYVEGGFGIGFQLGIRTGYIF